MTNRTQEIERSLSALATALHQHHEQTTGASTAVEERALSCWEHGWDSVAQGYEAASEYLGEVAGELAEVSDRTDRCLSVLQQLHGEHGLTGVADQLSAATSEIDIGLDRVLAQLAETHSVLAATGEEYFAEFLHRLIETIQGSAEALTTLQNDIADELASSAAGRTTGGKPESEPSGTLAAIRTRITELSRQGHSPQRHGTQVTDRQLTDRALWGIDPMTGTTTDGVHGGTHQYSRNATKFTSDEALIRADQHIRSTSEYSAKERECQTTGRRTFVVRAPLKDVFGPDYLNQVKGIRRTGSQRRPTGDPPGSTPPEQSDLHDGFVHAVFRRTSDGEYHLTTMYPDPKE